jgi:hypothetical protein
MSTTVVDLQLHATRFDLGPGTTGRLQYNGMISFNAADPDLAVLRQVIFARLREQSDWKHLDPDPAQGYQQYLVLSPPRYDDRQVLEYCVLEVFWQLVSEGIIAPGVSANQGGFPWFRITQYGRRVLTEREYVPHDTLGYLRLLHERLPKPDATVLAYLSESLDTFVRGNTVASMVMLGVAAERVFLLTCDSISVALADAAERKQLETIAQRNPMKPKVDWVHDKLRRLQDVRPRLNGLPENATLMVTAIYDLIRGQRNDLGHPRDLPPRLSRGDSNANLIIFPRYYETAEKLREFLSRNKV